MELPQIYNNVTRITKLVKEGESLGVRGKLKNEQNTRCILQTHETRTASLQKNGAKWSVLIYVVLGCI